MTISVARSAIQAASSGERRAAAPAAAAGAGGSGNREWETALTSTPTPTPTASVTLSCPTSACSATPATGISANDSTRIAVSGLPLVKPTKKIEWSTTAVINTAANA